MIRYGDDGYIAVSRLQPLMTEVGIIRAQDLRPGNKLIDKDGNPVEIKLIYQSEYNNTVYQLVFDIDVDNFSHHFYVANGIFVGDLRKQNEMQPDRR